MSRRSALLLALAACSLAPASMAHAGPPYVTDDPDPVEHRHWELYLATQHELTRDGAVGTAPHVEINYGAVPNLQLHLIVPVAYSSPSGARAAFGPGDVELGAKLRFIQESDRFPMVGTFPLLELPAGSEARGLGTGRLHAFIPIWLQKTSGRWSTYGGGGFWLNPGEGNRDFWYLGWQAQRKLGASTSLGAEVFYTTPDRVDGGGNLRFNLGCIVDLSDHHHVLLSAGRSIAGDTIFQGYLAYQLTL